MAEGHGGQIIAVMQDKNLVIVLTADPYSSDWILSPGYGKMFGDIVDAVIK